MGLSAGDNVAWGEHMITGHRARFVRTVSVLLLALVFLQARTIFAADAPAASGPDINLSPLRVVFGNSARSQTVFVFNHGPTAATYKVDLIDRTMTDDGRLMTVAEAEKDPALATAAAHVKSARDFIVFTPRRITLQPNESQTIRVQVLRPAGLAAGEYRTHLTVTTVPPEDTGLTAEQAAKSSKGELAFRIVPVFSLSIPLIVRQGPPEIRAALEGAHVVSGNEPAVTADLVRTGANSVYGDVKVLDGRDLIGFVKGVAVYPEIARRAVRIPLTKKPKSGDTLSLVFLDGDQNVGAELAKETLKAP